jgi:hypothetical protein
MKYVWEDTIVPFLVESFKCGDIVLDPKSHWHFHQITKAFDEKFYEAIGDDELPWASEKQEVFEQKCGEAAEIIRNFPLMKALE